MAKFDSPLTGEQRAAILGQVMGTQVASHGSVMVMLRFGDRPYTELIDHDVWIVVDAQELYLSFRCASETQIEALHGAIQSAMSKAGIPAQLVEAE